MAKGGALHPRLVVAWDEFAAGDQKLRAGVESINDRRSLQKLAAVEKAEGKSARYHVEALMINAKRVLRAADKAQPDIAAMTAAIGDCEAGIKGAEASGGKIGSLFTSNAKSFLTTAKQLMRRVRDHVPYSQGERMMLDSGGGGWMVDGSPPRLLRDYNQLVDAYNRGANI
jgi:hypothetical protein